MARRRKSEVADLSSLPVLGTAEVGAVLGWSRNRVAVSHSRGQLPAPLAVLACGPIWRREDIVALLASAKAGDAATAPADTEQQDVEAAPAVASPRKRRRHKWEEVSLPKGRKGFRLYRGEKLFLQVSPNPEWGGWWAEVWATDRKTWEQDIIWIDTRETWTEEDAKEAALAGLEEIKERRRNTGPPQETEPAKRITECGKGYIMDYPAWIMAYNRDTDSRPATEATRRRYREAVMTYAIWWEMEGPGRWSGEAFTPFRLKDDDVAEFAVAMGVMHWLNTKAANRVVTALAPFWRWAQRWRYIPKGPSPISAAKLPEPKAKKKRRKVKAVRRRRT